MSEWNSPVRLLDLTLPTPAGNVALDEALLEEREAEGGEALLRVWESEAPMVVIGRSSRIDREVNRKACAADGVPVLRRCSGGAAIVAGPGCLMYALVLDYASQPELRSLTAAHLHVMQRLRRAMQRLGIHAEMQGTCDLTSGNRKVSGNAMRARKNWLLYHGTLLCQMDLNWVSRYLGMPDRQPDYRRGRSHDEFLTGLPVKSGEMKRALVEEFQPLERALRWPDSLTAELVREKYTSPKWNEAR